MGYDAIKLNVDKYVEKKTEYNEDFSEFTEELEEFQCASELFNTLDSDLIGFIDDINKEYQRKNDEFESKLDELRDEKDKNEETIYKQLALDSIAKEKAMSVLNRKYGSSLSVAVDVINTNMDKYCELLDTLGADNNIGIGNSMGSDSGVSNDNNFDGLPLKDDNGKPYAKDNNLIPNNSYTINGYTYSTDRDGRIVSAQGKLQIKNHVGRSSLNVKMQDIGKGDQKLNDDRGHLIADLFNGSNGIGNLVAMDSWLNEHGEYRKMEETLRKAVDDNRDVYFQVKPVYSKKSNRPDKFLISFSIDGDRMFYVFDNSSSKTYGS